MERKNLCNIDDCSHICKGKMDGSTWMEGYFVKGPDNSASIIAQDAIGEVLGVVPVCIDTVCRCAGLADKSKIKKIFEGDILVTKESSLFPGGTIYPSYTGIVRYGEFRTGDRECHLGFYVDWEEGCNYRKDLPYWAEKLEVAGNVFDNPELLK